MWREGASPSIRRILGLMSVITGARDYILSRNSKSSTSSSQNSNDHTVTQDTDICDLGERWDLRTRDKIHAMVGWRVALTHHASRHTVVVAVFHKGPAGAPSNPRCSCFCSEKGSIGETS